MKDSTKYASILKKLYNYVKREEDVPEPTEPQEPSDELVLACLSQYAPESKARTALGKLQSNFVDYNELRVARVDEIVAVLGKTYPQARETAQLLRRVLAAIFDANHSLELNFLRDRGKREAKAYLEELDGVTPYVVARVMLRGLGAHAFPVNDDMLTMLRDEEAIDPEADAATVQGFLERHISVTDVHDVYAWLRYHADNHKPGEKSLSKTRNNSSSHKKTAKTRKTRKKTTKSKTT